MLVQRGGLSRLLAGPLLLQSLQHLIEVQGSPDPLTDDDDNDDDDNAQRERERRDVFEFMKSILKYS